MSRSLNERKWWLPLASLFPDEARTAALCCGHALFGVGQARGAPKRRTSALVG
jgi:hypothetical protein